MFVNSLMEEMRPNCPEELVGASRSQLEALLKQGKATGGVFPRFIIIEGNAGGIGKNTFARIIAGAILNIHPSTVLSDAYGRYIEFGAQEQNSASYSELMNIGRNFRPYAPIGGVAAKIFVLDEAHQIPTIHISKLNNLTENDIEYRNIYIIMLTTNFALLKKNAGTPLLTRAVHLNLPSLTPTDQLQLIENILTKFPTIKRPSDEVVRYIIRLAAGSARETVKLVSVLQSYSDEEALDYLKSIEETSLESISSASNCSWYLLEAFIRNGEVFYDTSKKVSINGSYQLTHLLFSKAVEGCDTSDAFKISLLSICNKRMGLSQNPSEINVYIAKFLSGQTENAAAIWKNADLKTFKTPNSTSSDSRNFYHKTLMFVDWVNRLPDFYGNSLKHSWKVTYLSEYIKLLKEDGILK